MSNEQYLNPLSSRYLEPKIPDTYEKWTNGDYYSRVMLWDQLHRRPGARMMLNDLPATVRQPVEMASFMPPRGLLPTIVPKSLWSSMLPESTWAGQGSPAGLYHNLQDGISLNGDSGAPGENPWSTYSHELEHGAQEALAQYWPKELPSPMEDLGSPQAPGEQIAGRGDYLTDDRPSYKELYTRDQDMALADKQRATLDDLALRRMNSRGPTHVQDSLGEIPRVPRGLTEQSPVGGSLRQAQQGAEYSPYLPGIYKTEYNPLGTQRPVQRDPPPGLHPWQKPIEQTWRGAAAGARALYPGQEGAQTARNNMVNSGQMAYQKTPDGAERWRVGDEVAHKPGAENSVKIRQIWTTQRVNDN